MAPTAATSRLPWGLPASLEPLVQGFKDSLSQKNKTALSGKKSATDVLKQEPLAPLRTSPTMRTVNSSETPWLLRFTCPTPVREHDQQRTWQAAPDESQDIIASAQCVLDREKYFVRGYVALEAYDPSEYDPFFLKTCTDCWKVSIPTLQDPLLKDIQRKFIETGIIKQCETGRPCSTRELKELSKAELPLLPLSRQRMDAVEWLKIPHAYIASEVHQRKRRKVINHHKDGES